MSDYSMGKRWWTCAITLAIAWLVLFFGTLPAQTHSVTLTWTWDQGSGGLATGYKVYRGQISGGSVNLIHTVTPETTMTYVDTSVGCGKTYYYQVTAFNAGGESMPTTQVPAIIPTCALPLAPANLVAQVN